MLNLLAAYGVPGNVRLERIGDPLLLLELWRAEDHVILVDAAKADAPPGTCLTVDALAAEIPEGIHPLSSHGMGLVETVALARALGRLPEAMTVHAVVGVEFSKGAPMSEPVREAAEVLASRLHEAIAAPSAPAPPRRAA